MAAVAKKKKKWYSIYAPSTFRGQHIGETMAVESSSLIGRTVYVNLMNLIEDPKKQNYRILFKVVKIEGEKAVSDLMSYEMILTYVKRMMRKGVEKIEDSFIVQSNDNIKIQVKPMLLAKNKVKNSVATAIRKTARGFIGEMAGKQTYSDFMYGVALSKIQRQLRENINKVYPLVACEFRIVKRL
ncbi:hypothetical protein J4409_00425 [Candidatus Woesearchaeota archaeon]|nr:hypothetical protein [Candidatus Woesearchaeota archaeon]